MFFWPAQQTKACINTTMQYESIRCTSCIQATSLSFTFAHGLTFRIRLPLSGFIEVPFIQRLVVPETILFLLLTITPCRQTCADCLHHSSSIPVESEPGFVALLECQFQRLVTTLCALIFDFISRFLIKMMRIIDMLFEQIALLLCRQHQGGSRSTILGFVRANENACYIPRSHMLRTFTKTRNVGKYDIQPRAYNIVFKEHLRTMYIGI